MYICIHTYVYIYTHKDIHAKRRAEETVAAGLEVRLAI